MKQIETIVLGSEYNELPITLDENPKPQTNFRNRTYHRNSPYHTHQVYASNGQAAIVDTKPKNLSAQPLKLSHIKPLSKSRKRKLDESDEQPNPSSPLTSDVTKLSQAFFPNAILSRDELNLFASRAGFNVTRSIPVKVLIHATCNKLEVTITTDRFGVVQDIQHSKVRWLSATFMRYRKQDSDDVRTCFDIEKKLNRDENSIFLYLAKTLLFSPEFIKAINADFIDCKKLPKNPMMTEGLRVDWKLHNLRIQRCISRYENTSGDSLEYNEVYDGAFDSERKVDWFEKKRNELRIDMSTIQDAEDLCRSSYNMSLKLFNFSKAESEN